MYSHLKYVILKITSNYNIYIYIFIWMAVDYFQDDFYLTYMYVQCFFMHVCSLVAKTSTTFCKRARFADNQTISLQAAFKFDHYPNLSRKIQLANQTNLSVKQVEQWYERRRAGFRQGKGEFRIPTSVCTSYALY